ncbi:hypothetical protein DAEQUDRAFT_26597 [Daedalea quercina L-15889]|uniref:Uncharacterized protein n=1 Tax=Daedalea quercina L-15889 TaxID=1314783 RepID=A0A165SNQ0_9APHY|nr:hypothetical protein DAEQUDRAFT_26597 [Daedalea quercina L-15889]
MAARTQSSGLPTSSAVTYSSPCTVFTASLLVAQGPALRGRRGASSLWHQWQRSNGACLQVLHDEARASIAEHSCSFVASDSAGRTWLIAPHCSSCGLKARYR